MTPKPSLSVLFERLARIVHNDAHSLGLKPTQWEALRYVARANRFSRTPGALTVYLGMTKGTVSQTVSALEKKSLISKIESAKDKRAINLELTAKGQRLLAEDPLLDLEAAFPASQREILAEALSSGLKKVLSHRRGKPFGACKTCMNYRADDPAGSPNFCTLLSEPLTDSDSEMICIEQEAA